MTIIDEKIMNVLVQKSESSVVANSDTSVHSSEVSGSDLPENNEAKPELPWLPGLEPDQVYMERCIKLTELSKTLKHTRHED
jgi:hypothetical protein